MNDCLFYVTISTTNNNNHFDFLSLQRMNVMPINSDAVMDVVYQSDGNVIKRKIVVMEAMKMPAIVVSYSSSLH